MALTIELGFCEFTVMFHKMGREDNFSYHGLRALFDHLEDYSDSTGEDVKIDVIGLCCEYSEDDYSSIAENYGIDLSDCEDEDDKINTVREYL